MSPSVRYNVALPKNKINIEALVRCGGLLDANFKKAMFKASEVELAKLREQQHAATNHSSALVFWICAIEDTVLSSLSTFFSMSPCDFCFVMFLKNI